MFVTDHGTAAGEEMELELVLYSAGRLERATRQFTVHRVSSGDRTKYEMPNVILNLTASSQQPRVAGDKVMQQNLFGLAPDLRLQVWAAGAVVHGAHSHGEALPGQAVFRFIFPPWAQVSRHCSICRTTLVHSLTRPQTGAGATLRCLQFRYTQQLFL